MDKILIDSVSRMFVEMLADVAIRNETKDHSKEDILSEIIEVIKEHIGGDSRG